MHAHDDPLLPPTPEFRTPIEIWHDIQMLIAAAEQDAHKATRGMRAGGSRVRLQMQTMIQLATEMRRSVLKHRKARRKRANQPAKSTSKGAADLLAS